MVKNNISAIIITKNEEKNIAACLESIKWVDEIIVVDSDSADNTQNICREHGAKVVASKWEGFGPQKNKALKLAQHEWILSIDADERVSQKLRDEILEITAKSNYKTDSIVFVAYKIPRQNYFYKRHIKHALNAKNDAPIRLFRKQAAQFSNDLVHEEVIVQGAVGKLVNSLLHYPFKDLEELLNKANLYSTLGAQKLIAKKTKPSILKTLLHAKWAFIRIYFLKLGFLDGWPGFLIALANFEGTFYRYAKLLEKAQKKSCLQEQ